MTKWEYRVLSLGHEFDSWRGWKDVFGLSKEEINELIKAGGRWFWSDAVKKKDLELALLYPEERLNQMGKEGWECFAIVQNLETIHPSFGRVDTNYDYFFKRTAPN